MKSPFPGMDPYLEDPAIWSDFHNSFMTYLREAIAARLPDRYDAHLEEQVRIVEAPKPEAGTHRPDLPAYRYSESRAEIDSTTDAVAVLDATAVVPLGEELLLEVKDVRIDIYRWPGSELITTIELPSPWNKSGDGFSDFTRKRRAVLMTEVNWVEIDLLVGGERITFDGPTPKADYRVVIARATNRPNAEIYAWNVRDKLPAIPIPLRHPDHSIAISLAKVFDMTYERGRMDKALRRLPAGPPSASLRDEDQKWAAEVAGTR